MKRKVEVTLLGQRFAVRSDRDEAYLHQVASFVNRKYDELQRQARTATSHQLALLVAMNLADEMFRNEERHADVRQELQSRTERVLASVDAALAEMSRHGSAMLEDFSLSDTEVVEASTAP